MCKKMVLFKILCSKDGKLKNSSKKICLKIFTVVIIVVFIVVSMVLRSAVIVVIFIETWHCRSSAEQLLFVYRFYFIFCCTQYTVQCTVVKNLLLLAADFNAYFDFFFLFYKKNQYVISRLVSNVLK